MFRKLCLILIASVAPALAAPSDKQRYDDCLALAATNPQAALGVANKWQTGGPPARHCSAVALVGLKRYAEAAAALDELGRAPGMGSLRPSLFDQAGNAWMLGGEIGKAVNSFQAALALAGNDADLYADLARAQAMQSAWPEVEADLNAALALSPLRADLFVLRASARRAQNHLADARKDAEAALALSPRNPEALVERGSIRRESGDMKGARADFLAALAAGASPAAAEAARRNIVALDAIVKPVRKKSPPTR